MDGGELLLHDDSILTSVMGANFGAIQEVNVATATVDLDLDSNGTQPAPIRHFKIMVASPSFDLAPDTASNPISLSLELTLVHPCRNAFFSSQVISDMSAIVHGELVE